MIKGSPREPSYYVIESRNNFRIYTWDAYREIYVSSVVTKTYNEARRLVSEYNRSVRDRDNV